MVYVRCVNMYINKALLQSRRCYNRRANKRTHPRILMGAPVVTDPTLGESLNFVSESYLTGSHDIRLSL